MVGGGTEVPSRGGSPALWKDRGRRGNPAGFAVFSHHRSVDPAADIEFGRQSQESRLHGGGEIAHYLVRHGFMESAAIAK
jgi:hypothetical protein